MTKKGYNPYKRIEEIDEDLKILEAEEKEFMKKRYKSKPRRYLNVEKKIFFLVIEKLQIEKCLNYFNKEFKIIEKKYPEHYWRWQFYGKILNPDKVIHFISETRGGN
jgi:hypothetical protein